MERVLYHGTSGHPYGFARQAVTEATLYLSYVLADETERANRVVLESEEIGLRMQRVKAEQKGSLLVIEPKNRPAYDAYLADVRAKLQNPDQIEEVVGVEEEPKTEGEGDSASASQQ